jgi:hypothetical protein
VTTYTVSIDNDGSDAALHRMVLAGLPNSYRLVEQDAEVVLVSAPDPAAVARRCSSNTRAVVIDQPGLLSPGGLAAIGHTLDRHECIVVPALRYAPRLAAAGDLLGDCRVDILQSTVTSGRSLRSSLVEQLALLRTALGAVASIRALSIHESHYVFAATMLDHPQASVLLNGMKSSIGTDEATLHCLSAQQRVVVRIDAGPVARPAEICCYDASGTRTPWPVHQHAHRLTLAQLHRVLTTGEGNVLYSFEHLRHDVQLVDACW